MAAEKDEKSMVVVESGSLFFNPVRFEHAQRVARVFAESDLVPKHFRGKIANCLIGLNYAERMGLDPFMVLQNLYVVHGRPGLESKLVIALINQSGKYSTPLSFRFDGEGDDYGCAAYATEAVSRQIVVGPKVTKRMVKAEGWDKDKKNAETGYVQVSKWNTIPDLMYRYRAASFFANVNCPEVKLGLPTADELHESIELQAGPDGSYGISDATRVKLEDMKKRFAGDDAVEVVGPVGPSAPAVEAENGEPDSAHGKRRGRQRKDASQPATQAQPEDPTHDKAPAEEAPVAPAVQDAPPQNPEVLELEGIKKKLAAYEKDHLPYVLQSKRNLQIAHAVTLDAARMLLEEVERLLKERPPR